MNKEYKPSIITYLHLVFVALIFLVVSYYSNNLTVQGITVFLALIFIAGLIHYLGTGVWIFEGVLYAKEIFIKRKININEIDAIKYKDAYGAGHYIQIDHKNNSTVSFAISVLGYKQKHLSDLLKFLKQINPEIKFDERALEYINKYN
ncbi:MAG: hypothetical protein ABL917_01535 [Parcubacteria group bacterium]